MARPSRVVTIHQPEFLPWLGFFDKLRQCDVFVLLDHVQYEKHYFQNRNRIRSRTPQAWSWLTVPVRLKGRFGQPIQEVEIHDTTDWRRKHLTAIEMSYRKARAFDAYWASFTEIYRRPWQRLAELNIALIEWLAGSFGLRRTVLRSSELGVDGSRSQLLLAICQRAGATEYLSGISGRDYLDTALFEEAGIRVTFQEFHHPIYQQAYDPFVPGLSSIDLLLNYGAVALDVLTNAETPRLSALPA